MSPSWAGICSEWAIIRPRASNSPHEKSSISRMIGENDERYSTTAISSAMPWKACRRISG